MSYDKALVAGKLRRWEKYLENYSLPKWEEIPDFGLYMDQVLTLLKEYLDYLPPELKDEEFVTASTINNYVRKKFMPEPVKKRYYRIHIAYLIMICTLKQSLSLTMLQKIIPSDMSETMTEQVYSSFASRHKVVAQYFLDMIRLIGGDILDHENNGEEIIAEDTDDLITTSAVIGGFSRLLAEKLLLLDGKSLKNGDRID